nr:unnamed protein product [Digitaria exilis]
MRKHVSLGLGEAPVERERRVRRHQVVRVRVYRRRRLHRAPQRGVPRVHVLETPTCYRGLRDDSGMVS